jgi:hypothetical protein
MEAVSTRLRTTSDVASDNNVGGDFPLSGAECELCATLQIDEAQFRVIKAVLHREFRALSARVEAESNGDSDVVKQKAVLGREAARRHMLKIAVNKQDRLCDFFVECGILANNA